MMLKQNTKFRLPHKILAQNLLVKVPLQHKTTFKIFGVLFFVDCTHHTYDICLLIISMILYCFTVVTYKVVITLVNFINIKPRIR